MTAGTHILAGFLTATFFNLPVLPAVIGSIVPDVDLGKGLPHPSQRTLFNSHRGITHHPVIPIVFFILSYLLKANGFQVFSEYLSSFSLGYASHLLLDILNPLGIPYTFSYYPRLSLKLMKSGKLGEIFVILLLIAVLTNVIGKREFKYIDSNSENYIKKLVKEVIK